MLIKFLHCKLNGFHHLKQGASRVITTRRCSRHSHCSLRGNALLDTTSGSLSTLHIVVLFNWQSPPGEISSGIVTIVQGLTLSESKWIVEFIAPLFVTSSVVVLRQYHSPLQMVENAGLLPEV